MQTKQNSARLNLPVFLGIECGGTHSDVIAARTDEETLFKFTAGPANLRLVNDAQLEKHFAEIRNACDGMFEISGVAIGMAGARTEQDRDRIRKAAGKVWPTVPYRPGRRQKSTRHKIRRSRPDHQRHGLLLLRKKCHRRHRQAGRMGAYPRRQGQRLRNRNARAESDRLLFRP